jgi:hypothetical protein
MWLTSLDLRNNLVSDKMSLINPTFVPFIDGRYTFATGVSDIFDKIFTLEGHVAVEVLL